MYAGRRNAMPIPASPFCSFGSQAGLQHVAQSNTQAAAGRVSMVSVSERAGPFMLRLCAPANMELRQRLRAGNLLLVLSFFRRLAASRLVELTLYWEQE